MGEDRDVGAVDGTHAVFGENRVRGTVDDESPLVEEEEPVAVGGGEGEVVNDDADGDAGGGELAEQGEDLGLGFDVEIGGRFVEQEGSWLLGERAGDEGAPTLAAGEGVEVALGEGGATGALHGGGDDRPVAGGLAAEQTDVRMAAERDEFAYAHGVRGEGELLNDGKSLSDLAGGEVVEGLAVEVNSPTLGGDVAGDGAQEGALAGAVGADDTGQVRGGEGEGDAPQDLVAAEGDVERDDADRRGFRGHVGGAGMDRRGGHRGIALRGEGACGTRGRASACCLRGWVLFSPTHPPLRGGS